MAEIDYYDILDIRPTAGPEEIKAAYHRAARSAHPDAGGTAGMFRLVTEAYRTLSDPHLRAAYDARSGGDSTPASPAGFATTSAEPDWGEEVRWDAGVPMSHGPDLADETPTGPTEPEEFVDRQFGKLDRWMVSGAGPTVLRWATVIAVVIYAAITYVLVERPDLVRPDAAGDDAWGDLLANTSVLRFMLIAYAVLALGGYFGILWIPLAIVHAATFLCIVVWFVMYWGMASDTERAGFTVIAALWCMYSAVMAAVPLLREYRSDGDAQPA
ncbi:J domain-containing protein [Jiangella ureilytica]|uniref:J domain-containing protein n=1 Tax=Jiangella ureilytica TaxID=2530374 RepID=A0A4V2XW88_9ACTN|nr:J domain-containing protein [Jiangella ureilytica]TDC48325.1 J domain-containing protein [Jiangella ureilytica]